MKLLVIQCAALGYELWERYAGKSLKEKLTQTAVKTVFPALTCPVQASFRTGLYPQRHGITANGFYDRKLHKTFFWEQSADLYKGSRIWENIRMEGGRAGQICWQQSLGENIDLILSPAPIHKHHGGMIQDVYSYLLTNKRMPLVGKIYKEICDAIGYSFDLFSYWGPFTSIKSTKWIVDATIYCMDNYFGTDRTMLLTYLPHLDYELQRSGPDGRKISHEFSLFEAELLKLLEHAENRKWDVLIFGDYAINNVSDVIFPNKILAKHGIMLLRNINGHLYADLHQSQAFALTDHQIAHIFIKNKTRNNLDELIKLFSDIEKIEDIIITDDAGFESENQGEKLDFKEDTSGDIILIARKGAWFAYPWWENKKHAPDYALHVDIHNKPGFDPCDLFISVWPPFSISPDVRKVKGSHGRTEGDENLILCAASFSDIKKCESIVHVANLVRNIC